MCFRWGCRHMCQYKLVCASLEQRHIEVTSAEPQGAWWRGMEVTSIICHLDWLFIPIKTEYSISQLVCCPSHHHHSQNRSIYRRLISLHWMVIYFVHQWNINIVFGTMSNTFCSDPDLCSVGIFSHSPPPPFNYRIYGRPND